jgi:hypothetical protein
MVGRSYDLILLFFVMVRRSYDPIILFFAMLGCGIAMPDLYIDPVRQVYFPG